MGIAESINNLFTIHAMNPARRRAKPAAPVKPILDTRDPLCACVLEHQGGVYCTFRLADKSVLHFHECKAEVQRRTERDGYYLTFVA